MTRSRIQWMLAAAGLCLTLQHADAQTAGSYTGTIADGSTLNFTVGMDANNVLAVTSFGFNFTDTCHPGSTTFSNGWGLFADAPITANKATYTNSFGYLNVAATFRFNGGTATGTIVNQSPTFAPFTGKAPKSAVFCTSPTQTFTAAITPAAAPRLHPTGATLLQGRAAK